MTTIETAEEREFFEARFPGLEHDTEVMAVADGRLKSFELAGRTASRELFIEAIEWAMKALGRGTP